MSKAKAIVEGEVFERLTAAITDAAVYQDAPEDEPFPLVIIGDLKSAKIDTKGNDGDRLVTVAIVTLVEAQERAPLLTLQEQIEDALDGQTITTADGWTLGFTFDDDDAVLSEDGATYSGVTTFRVLALEP